jgi:hypothetical protein
MDTLARERAGRTPDLFPIALGIDHVEAMVDWLVEDAVDSVNNAIPTMAGAMIEQGAAPQQAMRDAIGSTLATHSQMYLELGLWLAQTGRVKL